MLLAYAVLVSIFAFFIVAERIWLRKINLMESGPGDSITNLLLSALHQLSDNLFVLYNLFWINNIYDWLSKNGLHVFNSDLNFYSVLWLLIIQDFLYYWYHRASHNIRWLWCSHITHHLSKNMNFTVGFRQSVLHPFTGTWIFWLPLAFLGYTQKQIFLISALNLVYQFFVHTRMIRSSGIFKYFLNTPSHHRVHHGINDAYLNKNFAGIFTVWDHLFGTYAEEREKVVYGTIAKYDANSILGSNMSEFLSMLKKIFKARSWRDRYSALVLIK